MIRLWRQDHVEPLRSSRAERNKVDHDQLKVKEDVSSETEMPNVACIEFQGDTDSSNNCDDALVKVEPFAPFTESEPFLPFTGGDGVRLALLVMLLVVAGVMLRRLARVSMH